MYYSSLQTQILFHHLVLTKKNDIMFKHDCKAADEKMCECFPVASACGLVLKLPVQHGEHF